METTTPAPSVLRAANMTWWLPHVQRAMDAAGWSTPDYGETWTHPQPGQSFDPSRIPQPEPLPDQLILETATRALGAARSASIPLITDLIEALAHLGLNTQTFAPCERPGNPRAEAAAWAGIIAKPTITLLEISGDGICYSEPGSRGYGTAALIIAAPGTRSETITYLRRYAKRIIQAKL